jgi:hypothetical protein
MNKIIDIYYRFSILIDIILCAGICTSLKLYEIKYSLLLNYKTYDRTLCSDLGSIGLTIGGFLLTISTILISFKITALYDKSELMDNSNTFKIFISSKLYFKTVSFLNKSVLILVLLSLSNYLFKIVVQPDFNYLLFYLNICTIFIIFTTFSRCLYVLNMIIKMQK